MTYFSYFPMKAYSVTGGKDYKLVPEIIKRVKLRSNLRSGLMLFDKYDVKYGENPEDIAFKYYDDPGLHWVILMTNNITDRYYQWPLTQPQLDAFLTDKYGAGSEDAIHHYEKTQDSGLTAGQGPDDYSHLVEVNSDEDNASSISNRQYEERLQDQYRQIQLLDQRYISQFVEEFERLIQE